ncbi:MAG: UbiA family prenyltransferase [Chitinophagales bacterium]
MINLHIEMLRFTKILIETNLFIAFAAVAFLWSTILLLDFQSAHFILLSLQVFFSTWFVYQISRWIYFKKGMYTNKDELVVQWFEKYPKLNEFTIYASGILAVVLMFFLQWKTIIVLCVVGLISVLYPVPFLKPFGITTRLRDVPFVKLFLISFVWSATSVVLPALEANINLHERRDVWILFVAQFIFILFITLPFDINDEASDKASNVKTIPVFFGVKVSKVICLVLGIVYSFIMLFLFALINWNHSPNKYLPEATIILIWVLLILLQVFTFYKSASAKKWIIKVVYDGSMLVYFLIMYFTIALFH